MQVSVRQSSQHGQSPHCQRALVMVVDEVLSCTCSLMFGASEASDPFHIMVLVDGQEKSGNRKTLYDNNST